MKINSKGAKMKTHQEWKDAVDKGLIDIKLLNKLAKNEKTIQTGGSKMSENINVRKIYHDLTMLFISNIRMGLSAGLSIEQLLNLIEKTSNGISEKCEDKGGEK